jgi:hypothetical protein
MDKVYIYKVCDGVWSWVGTRSLKSAQNTVRYIKGEVTSAHTAAEFSIQKNWEHASTLGEVVQKPNLKKIIDEGARVKVL